MNVASSSNIKALGLTPGWQTDLETKLIKLM